MKYSFSVLVLLAFIALPQAAKAASNASAQASATQTVEAGITLTKTDDLNFGSAVQGAASKVVQSASNDGENANFTVGGQPNRSFSVTLPSAAVIMNHSTGGGTADKEISVASFTSNAGTSLNGSGSFALIVGATRAAIRETQEPGSYSGVFTVTVNY